MGEPKQGSQETTDQMMQGYLKNLDALTQKTVANIQPTEQGLMDARRAIEPQQNEFEAGLAEQYLPRFTQIGLDQQRQQQMGQAATDRDVLNGPGRELVQANLAAQKIADPEYYKSREGTGAQLSRLFGSLSDPNEGLDATERAEIDRSLARTNQQRGIEAPTATSAVDSAMNFGAAGAARKANKQQAINAAVQTAGSVMPSLRSGVDVLQLTTGRPSMQNVGVGMQPASGNVGQTSMNLGSQLFSQAGNNARQTSDINSKKRTAFDTVMKTMDSTGGLISSI